ncbi:pentatricopeptide repeat-containing protein At5g48910-like isoform X1 [Momordica charantia]|uniref:Pentatricopeptide repeat-containing protein At5g48910-like isoform X1 n=2 Tax=Momordica charantia TaxID=3673 RepID=A0A6J1E2X3_MOMCH|nr:pentatricopeptide repeat-containing protein At5g48910-like isoform X1 [Momordica charantia]XP_022159627.1 pentatricopeptide repeat-containing protein At5g48910-like isoform X1 [Momordica charantia]XP_022159628.1 pentatricopeptide repeat-containing protein At5g48910-like isoform X1 [Momordica charantia]XP_022159629.1 pentatricopeptide repeat-containing protein At5g48910-like isoform X1 [Momordica charantia]
MSSITAAHFPSPLRPHESAAIPTSKLPQKTILKFFDTKSVTSLQYLSQVHGLVLRSGHFQDHYVSGALLKCYANPHFSNLDFALKVFSSIPNPNVFIWNIVIKGCVENNKPFEAIYFYGRMVTDARPNKFTYPTLFKACSVTQADQEGRQIHGHVVRHGLGSDMHIRSAGIQMYASFGSLEDAFQLFDNGESDVVCWNTMIDGYMKFGDLEAAKGLFERMPTRNTGSWNVMINGFAKGGKLDDARKVFDEMSERDEITWSSMVDGYVSAGCYKEALEIFHQMQREKIGPGRFILSSVLAACSSIGAVDQGRWVHAYLKRNSIKLDAVLGTALLDMYAKCGRLDMAWEVFEEVEEREVFTWNAMIGGLAIHGRAEDALELFSKMQKGRLKPNGITLVGVLSACAHAGLVDKGLRIFENMKEFYGIEPEMEHYGCVVDLLGRSGLFSEAEVLISSMPMKPNAAVWGALLGACKIHGNVELAERVGTILLELEPHNSGRYALLSNIYAKAGRFDDVAKIRKKMKERGIKTLPGVSTVDLNGTVHEFKMGDGSHPLMKEIYSMLEKIKERLQMAGYSPDTSQVLFDIEEEEKESALQYHSEKLAIAFGLINTLPGKTIHIVKNLRVCDDCHLAMKLISQIYNREIIVRDRVRYHHFRNGTCSCRDFW